MFEIGGVTLSDEELSKVIDSYLASRHYIMWARWDITKEGPSREDAKAWFINQIAALNEFLPVKADKPGNAPVESYYVPMDRASRQLVGVGD